LFKVVALVSRQCIHCVNHWDGATQDISIHPVSENERGIYWNI